MPPKAKSKKKKTKKSNKRETDGKNSLTTKSEEDLQVEDFPTDYTKSLMDDVTWDTLGGIPCFTCSNVKRCGVRQPISPVTCSSINSWLEYESLPPEEQILAVPEFLPKPEPKSKLKVETQNA